MSKEMTIEEEMHAMMQGNYTSEVMSDEDKQAMESDEIGDEIADSVGEEPTTENEEGNTSEDTKASETAEVETETNGEEVAQNQETGEANTAEEKEDTQVGEVEKKSEDTKEDEPEESNESTNYKQQYEELLGKYNTVKAFQDKVTSDFKANGKIVNGITDPDKIVKNLQMSTGMANKLNGYKTVKPFIKPLEDRGLFQDTSKFDMLMKLADGDKDALIYYMQEHQIDPLELDTDDKIEFNPTSTLASREELMFNEMHDIASNYGVGDRFSTTVLKEWDSDSAAKLFESDSGMQMSTRLAEQMSNGIYDKVNAIAENMKITENGFHNLSSLEQYEAASQVYNQKVMSEIEQHKAQEEAKLAQEQSAQKAEAQRLAAVEAEKARLAKESQEREYAIKAETERKKLETQRDRATSVSQPRTVAETAPVDPVSLGTEDFRAQWKALLNK